MFSGHSRDSIARNVRASGGTVSHVWCDFKNDACKKGIKEAAKAYNLEEMVDDLRRLSVDLYKAHMTVGQSLSGARILTRLKTLNIGEAS